MQKLIVIFSVLLFSTLPALGQSLILNYDNRQIPDSLNLKDLLTFDPCELDSLVGNYEESLNIKDTFDLFGTIEKLKIGEYYEQINFDSIIQSIDWNIMAKEINWDEVMSQMDWNEMLDLMCNSDESLFQNSPIEIDLAKDSTVVDSEGFNNQTPSNCFKSGNEISNMMEAVDLVCLMANISFMLSDSLEDNSMIDMINVFQGKQSRDETPSLQAYCKISKCIDANVLFLDLDWNCMMKNFDFNQILQHWKLNDLLRSMDSVKVNDSNKIIQNKLQDHPLAKVFQSDLVLGQFKSSFKDHFYDSQSTVRINQNFYDNIFGKHWNSDNASDLKNALELITPLWYEAVDNSRSSKYFINALWLFNDIQQANSQLDFEKSLNNSLLLKDILINLLIDNDFDDPNSEIYFGNIINKNTLTTLLMTNLQVIATISADLGKHSLAQKYYELGVEFYDSISSPINPASIQEKYLGKFFSDEERNTLLNKFGIDSTLLYISLDELNESKHPKFINIYLKEGRYNDAITCYKLLKDLLVEASNENRIIPNYHIPNRAANKPFEYLYTQMIFSGMADILRISNMTQDPNYELYDSASNTLEEYQRYQLGAFLHNNIGTYYYQISNYELALDHLLTAWDRLKRIGESSFVLATRWGYETIEEIHDHKTPAMLAIVGNISQIYSKQKNYLQAISFIKESIEHLKNEDRFAFSESDLFENYLLLGHYYQLLGEKDKCLTNYSKCKKIAASSKIAIRKLNGEIAAAAYYRYLNKPDSALIHLLKAEKIAVEKEVFYRLPEIHLGIGYIYNHQKLYDRAIFYLDKSKEAASELSQFNILNQIHIKKGEILLEQNNLNEALISFENGIAIIEDSLFQNVVGTSSKQIILENSFDAYERAFYTAYKLGKYEQAYGYLQKSKARTLNDLLRTSVLQTESIPDDLRVKMKDIIAALNYNQVKLSQQSDKTLLKKNQRDLLNQRNILDTKIQTLSETYKVFRQAPKLKIESFQAQLLPNQAFLEYFMGENLYVTVITADQFEIIDLGGSQPMKKRIKEFVHLIDSVQFKIGKNILATDHLHKIMKSDGRLLFNKLILPVLADNNLSEINELIISPDQELHFLPFEILQLSDTLSQPLLSEYNIAYTHSGVTFSQQLDKLNDQKSYVKDLLVIHKSDFTEYQGLKNLKTLDKNIFSFPTNSIDFIAGQEASFEILQDTKLKNYRQIYISTHGIIDPIPDLSFLALTNSPLSMYNMFDLEFQNELVILSACKTAKGKVLRGSGIMSFTRALVLSGAQSVIISMWSIDDEATDEFFRLFFKYTSEGLTTENALSKSKLDFINSDKYNHPYYWAPFILFK